MRKGLQNVVTRNKSLQCHNVNCSLITVIKDLSRARKIKNKTKYTVTAPSSYIKQILNPGQQYCGSVSRNRILNIFLRIWILDPKKFVTVRIRNKAKTLRIQIYPDYTFFSPIFSTGIQI